MNPIAQNVMFAALAFLVGVEGGRLLANFISLFDRKKFKPAPPPPPPERTLTTKDLEDILDMFIQYQGSVVTDVRTVEVPPVAIKEEEHNGHRELTEDDVLANLNPAPVAVREPPKVEVVKKKKGKK